MPSADSIEQRSIRAAAAKKRASARRARTPDKVDLSKIYRQRRKGADLMNSVMQSATGAKGRNWAEGAFSNSGTAQTKEAHMARLIDAKGKKLVKKSGYRAPGFRTERDGGPEGVDWNFGSSTTYPSRYRANMKKSAKKNNYR